MPRRSACKLSVGISSPSMHHHQHPLPQLPGAVSYLLLNGSDWQ